MYKDILRVCKFSKSLRKISNITLAKYPYRLPKRITQNVLHNLLASQIKLQACMYVAM